MMLADKIKELIQSVINDLMDGKDLSTILLKCQTVAFHLKNDEFSNWLNNEQNGYSDLTNLPNYRKVPASISVGIVGYGYMLNNKPIPQGAIDSKYAHLYEFTVGIPLSEIERIATSDSKSTVSQPINAAYTKVFQEIIQGGDVQEINRHVPSFSFVGILDSFKSKLLHFFLELDEELDFDLDFLNSSNQNKITQIINQNIYAGVVHTGEGDVNANKSTIVGGSNNNVSINDCVKTQIEELINQIEELNKRVEGDETDIAECIAEIQQEINSETPQPKLLKISLKLLKRIPKIAAESAIGVAIEKVIEQLF